MLAVLSPSKTQNFDDELSCSEHTQPALLKETKVLAKELKSYSEKKLASVLSVSPKLAALNAERFQDFRPPFSQKNARQALLAFRGDVYQGFELDGYKKADYASAQKRVRILSGFYGLLRPLDLIQPYRLEMKTKISVGNTRNLYDFWGDRITTLLNQELKATKAKFLVNLASNEYFKALQPKDISAPIYTAVFKEKKGTSFKVVALFAKQARGAMANFIVKNRLNKPEQLLDFNVGGYRYAPRLSSEFEFVFVR